MKHLGFMIFSSCLLFASEGERLFDRHCQQCHSKEPMTFNALRQKKHLLKAPPMNLVIERLKEVVEVNVGDETTKKAVLIAFMKDYIRTPSIDKGLCRRGCFIHFGVMPKIGNALSDEELHRITSWSYDHF